MTATETAPAIDSWTAQLDQLRARYKHVRLPVLAALNILVNDENVSVDDAKARADLHGIRITAASLNAARTLLSKMDTKASIPSTAASAPAREPRRPRAADKAIDAEELVRGFVAKLQGQGNAEAEKLRDGIRRTITILQGLVRI